MAATSSHHVLWDDALGASSTEEQLKVAHETQRQLQISLENKRQQLLQAQAKLVETTKCAEVQERLLHDRRRAAEERLAHCAAREREAERVFSERLRALRKERDDHESQQAQIEEGWRALESRLQSNDHHTETERRRLQELLEEADAREAELRERMRAVAAQEREIEARRRQLEHRASVLRSLDAQRLDRLKAELRQRESLHRTASSVSADTVK